MKRFRNILLADQCTTAASAPAAAHEATTLARANDAKLTLHSVVPAAPRPQHSLRLGTNTETTAELVTAQRFARLSALADQLDHHAVGVDVAVGSPSGEIVRCVIRGQHDLVIIPGGDSEATTATARQILRFCPCPVWVLRPGFTGETVLAAVDPDDDPELNRLILELARSQALRCGGELRVVHAWEPYGHSLFLESTDYQTVASLAIEAEAAHRDALGATLSAAGFGCDTNTHLVEGTPHRAITGIIHLYRIDLLVMGSVGSCEPGRLLVGNTAEQVLKDIGCSVLVVKPPSFVSPLELREPDDRPVNDRPPPGPAPEDDHADSGDRTDSLALSLVPPPARSRP